MGDSRKTCLRILNKFGFIYKKKHTTSHSITLKLQGKDIMWRLIKQMNAAFE